MSTLFGHVKGAFTGAARHRPGLLKAADGGLLFLDEIGELGPDEQAMLLRAIEDRRFAPVGGDHEVASDFQLIAGTNRDLRDAVARGALRDDLLARINPWTFHLPGLAERREDIEPNLDYELERHATSTGRSVTMNAEARRRFLDFAHSPRASWAATFRDLAAAVARMAALADGGRITAQEVDEEIARLRAGGTPAAEDRPAHLARLLPPGHLKRIDLFDRLQLEQVIEVCRGSASLPAAGRRLFAVSRDAKAKPNDADRLRKYLARFGLSWRSFRLFHG